MKKKEKTMILIFIVVAVIIIVGLLIWRNAKNKNEQQPQQENNTIEEKYVDVLENGTKLNKSSKLKETKNLDGLEISNLQLTYADGIAVLLADVKNTTSQDVELTPVELTLLDDQGNTLEVLDGLISPVAAGETVQLNIGVSADYANAYDFKIVKK